MAGRRITTQEVLSLGQVLGLEVSELIDDEDPNRKWIRIAKDGELLFMTPNRTTARTYLCGYHQGRESK